MCDANGHATHLNCYHLFFIYSEPNPEFPTGLTFFAQSGFHLFVQQEVSRKSESCLDKRKDQDTKGEQVWDENTRLRS